MSDKPIMARKRTTSDIPDYLQDQFPSFSEDVQRKINTSTPPSGPYRIPSPQQMLRLVKAWRNQIAILLVVYMVWRTDWQTRIYGPTCVSQKPVTPPSLMDDGVNWHRFAYVQYVTSPEYLCSSLMFFAALHRMGSKAERVILYPSKYKDVVESRENMLLLSAEATYGVKTVPVEIQHKAGEYFKWADSLTKLLVFNQTRYKKILLVDSDSTLLRPMDELFFLPSQPAAMPRAYWLDRPMLGSHLILLEPSDHEFVRVKRATDNADFGVYDMEIMNKLYGRRENCIVLPHRKYALLSGEFRRKTHRQYMGDDTWDPKVAFEEASLIHFSDDPLPKPWAAQWEDVKDYQPKCEKNGNCDARDIWLTLYSDYWTRAQDVCWIKYGGLPS